jgi:hypothetical protein
MRRISFQTWTIPIALLIFCTFSFGLLVPMVGFYWDDWPTLWQYHMFGNQGFSEAYSVDRPFLAWIFMLTTPFIGESVMGWQIFNLLALWLCCLSFWWMLRNVWPGRTLQVTGMAFLFAVYPSFSQHYVAMIYSHHYLVFTLCLFSIGSMIAAYRQPKRFWAWTSLSLVSAVAYMFMLEYYFGLELLRPVFLWIAMGAERLEPRKHLRKVLRHWLPYIAIMMVFLVWRTILTETERGEVLLFSQLLNSPLQAALDLGTTILQDIYEVTILAWRQTINLGPFSRQERMILVGVITIIILAAIFVFIYLLKLRPDGDQQQKGEQGNRNRWAIQAILVGLFALLIGGWPFWATDLPIMLVFPWDRFTLPMMVGGSILVVGLIDLVLRRRLLKVLVLSSLVGLAVGYHFHTGLEYRKIWNKQRNLFWQLTWRVPGIEPGTALLTPQLPHTQYSDNSLTAPLNWIYNPGTASRELDYLMVSIETRYGNILTEFEEDIPIQLVDRNLTFDGSTSKVLVFYHEPPRCLTVVEPGVDKWPPKQDLYIKEAMRLSNPELIIVDPPEPASPPPHIFGAEPEDKWCYYFEKADLARQMGEWEKIPELGDQAYKHLEDLYFVNAPELIPFIQGYAVAGDWEKALDWSLIAHDLKPNIKSRLCDTWQGLLENTESSPQRREAIKVIEEQMGCTFH